MYLWRLHIWKGMSSSVGDERQRKLLLYCIKDVFGSLELPLGVNVSLKAFRH